MPAKGPGGKPVAAPPAEVMTDRSSVTIAPHASSVGESGAVGATAAPSSDSSPRVDSLEPSARFANLKERLKLLRSKKTDTFKSRLTAAAVTELVEEARFNRSAVIDDPDIIGKQLKELLSIVPQNRKAITVREIFEYSRKLTLPFPTSMLERQRLCALYRCAQSLHLREFDPGNSIVEKGAVGTGAYFLLSGTAGVECGGCGEEAVQAVAGQRVQVELLGRSEAVVLGSTLEETEGPGTSTSGADSDQGPAIRCLSVLGSHALFGLPAPATIKARSKVYCASLSRESFLEALRQSQEEVGSSSATTQLKQLMLMGKADRQPINVADIAAKLAFLDMFRSMSDEVRREVCGIVEYLSTPNDFTLFEEGDTICFCYVVIRGSVVFTKADPVTRVKATLGKKMAGEHFGTLASLSAGEKKRTFTATTVGDCEFAVINRIAYNRILKKQLQGIIDARAALVRSMSIMGGAADLAVQRVAFNSQTEALDAGYTIVNPACYPNKLFFVMEGECKLVWVTDEVSNPPPIPLPISQHCSMYGHNVLSTPRQFVLGGEGAAGGCSGGGGPGGTGGKGKKGEKESAAEREAKEGAKAIQQQMGNNASNNVCGCGCCVTSAIHARKRYNLEVARMGRGDVFNGEVLVGAAPALAVVAVSDVLLMSMEWDSVESCFGREAYAHLCKALQTQWELHSKRLLGMAAVRQGLSIDPSQYHDIREDPVSLSLFLDHFVPPGPSDFTLQQQGAAALVAGAAAAEAAAAGVSSMPMVSLAGALTGRQAGGPASHGGTSGGGTTSGTHAEALAAAMAAVGAGASGDGAVSHLPPTTFEGMCGIQVATHVGHGRPAGAGEGSAGLGPGGSYGTGGYSTAGYGSGGTAARKRSGLGMQGLHGGDLGGSGGYASGSGGGGYVDAAGAAAAAAAAVAAVASAASAGGATLDLATRGALLAPHALMSLSARAPAAAGSMDAGAFPGGAAAGGSYSLGGGAGGYSYSNGGGDYGLGSGGFGAVAAAEASATGMGLAPPQLMDGGADPFLHAARHTSHTSHTSAYPIAASTSSTSITGATGRRLGLHSFAGGLGACLGDLMEIMPGNGGIGSMPPLTARASTGSAFTPRPHNNKTKLSHFGGGALHASLSLGGSFPSPSMPPAASGATGAPGVPSGGSTATTATTAAHASSMAAPPTASPLRHSVTAPARTKAIMSTPVRAVPGSAAAVAALAAVAAAASRPPSTTTPTAPTASPTANSSRSAPLPKISLGPHAPLSVPAPASASATPYVSTHPGTASAVIAGGGYAGPAAPTGLPLYQLAPDLFPIVDSPVLITKANVHHVTSAATSRFSTARESALTSELPRIHPHTSHTSHTHNTAPGASDTSGEPFTPHGTMRVALSSTSSASHDVEGGDAGHVAILPAMTSYESVLRPKENKQDKRVMMLHDMAMKRDSRYIAAKAQEHEEEARRKLERKQAADEYKRKKAEAGSGGWVEIKKESNATPVRRPPSASRKAGVLGQTPEPVMSLASSRSSSMNGSFRVRSVRAWRRADEEVDLPLDRDALAPPLKDHSISQPTLGDIKYILNRWGDRWAGEREQLVRKMTTGKQSDSIGSRGDPSDAAHHPSAASLLLTKGLSKKASRLGSFPDKEEAEELWDLDLFGAPTFGPGLVN